MSALLHSAAKKSRSWTPREVDFLHEHYAKKGVRWCAKKLARSKNAVISAAYRYGVSVKVGRRVWMTYEIAFVREHYAAQGAKWCAQRLRRSVHSVRWAARSNGIKPADTSWTPKEIQQLCRCWQRGGDVHALAERLGRAVKTCYWKAESLGFPKKKRWNGEVA